MTGFKTALVQADPHVGDKAANLGKMAEVVEKNAAQLYLFGELYLSGYMARDLFPKLAEPLDGPSVREVARIAQEADAHIVFGMPERDAETGHRYNSSILVFPDGKAISYRKLYPANFGPFEELQYFRRGSELKVVRSDLGRIGLLICYDAFFPEVAKGLALQGAEILACISAAPATSTSFFEKIIPARAIENTCFFLYANLVGTELNMVFQGGTQAVGPRAEELGRAEDFQEGVVTFTVEPRDVVAARKLRPTIRDTRPEVLNLLREIPARKDEETLAPSPSALAEEPP
ncbi:MAG: carbon-nitrogen hydrolase family protein [Candidatus Thermoplasmatota archaeon]|nr:carbon-nitrogen hydrolase family protein [Candidatus Thermoplasmatota archaeon]